MRRQVTPPARRCVTVRSSRLDRSYVYRWGRGGAFFLAAEQTLVRSACSCLREVVKRPWGEGYAP